jgi:superfamily II DNA or RNA helicase
MTVVPARAAALRILAARHAVESAPRDSTFALAEFQREAVGRAHAITQRRGGVIIADSVGLGKTYIGAALIESSVRPATNVAVIIPASLRANWRRALKPLRPNIGCRIDLLTHGQLSRGFTSSTSYSLVVVDEAHAFRNPATRRYRALRRLSRAAQVVLLTATPVNNSLSDLYFQIRLFAADDAFQDLGIASLAGLLRGQQQDAGSIARLREAVVIRRTRAQLRGRFPDIALPDGQRLRFPRTITLETVPHQAVIGIREIEAFFERLEFAAHQSETTATLVALGLLKRLQSSAHAGLTSIDRLIGFHQQFLAALGQGRLLQPRAPWASSDQLCLTEVLLDSVPAAIDANDLAMRSRADLTVLRDFRLRLADADDAKLARLIELLAARSPPLRTIVFSEFRDTAEFLWRAARDRFQTGLVTGSEAYLGRERCSRAEVIRRFAPRANHVALPSAAEAVYVLFATDVLAEGLNLQDADAVVSYDLPWNPVRLIQRAGRIDRMGSAHEQVVVYNFMPDREFDELLGLVRRLRHKLRGLRSAVGQETPILEPDELAAAFYVEMDAQPPPLDPDHALDFSQAAPEGCLASTTARPTRFLVSWRRGGALREITIHADGTLADKQGATEIIERALTSSREEAPQPLLDAILASRAYLPTSAAVLGVSREAAMLGQAVRRAVQAYGLLADPELLTLADELIANISGNVYEPRQLAAIRKARTAAELMAAFREIRQTCRDLGPSIVGEWQLVAALGSD